MSVDPGLIRMEQFGEIGAAIQRGAGVIIERWCRRVVEERPTARRVHHDVLRDELPNFLVALARGLAESDDLCTPLHREPAAEHGAQRWETGWSLPEVVQDYQVLRLVILEYLEETLERNLSYRESMAVGLGLDDAISASVERYVADSEQAQQAQTAALKESHRRKDEFLAILAHELRNPLGSILNSVEVLRLAGSTEHTVIEACTVVERQARQMARLVDDLLDVTRIALGKMELRRRHFELASAVGQAVQTSAPFIESRQHTLSVNLPPETLWLDADPDRVVQILVNLLSNAAKYTEPGGRIALTCSREEDQVVIRIRDTGRGIPPPMLTRVFGLFTQLDPNPDRVRSGLGIGLTLVRRLAEMHGGEVTAHSEGPGRGSEFVVRLPLASLPQPQPPAATPQAPPASAPRHVLIVEDDPDGRETLKKLLQLSGHRVETAESGQQGVDTAMALRPQAALIDIGLPDLDGYQVARKIRAAFGETEIFLIAMTGFGQEDGKKNGGAVFDAHLLKPVDLEQLAQLLTSLPLVK